MLSDSISKPAHEPAHSETSSLISASVKLAFDFWNAVHRGYCCGGWADSLPYCFLPAPDTRRSLSLCFSLLRIDSILMKNLLLLTGLIITCFGKVYSQNSNEYSIEIDKEFWKTESIIASNYFDAKFLNDGSLHLHFQTAFENDSVEINVNGILVKKSSLTTEWSTSLADVIVIPNFETIKSVSISINGGGKAEFEIEKSNQIIVRLREDKLLIGFRNHVPYYD